jgi:molecular chaperone GrpE
MAEQTADPGPDNGRPGSRPERGSGGPAEPAGAAHAAGAAGRAEAAERAEPAGGAEAGGVAEAAATIAELRAQAARLEDQWRRATADLDNVRKRMAGQAGQARAEERARVAAEWLPVLDNLELALQHAGADPAAILPGVQAVRDQALAVLARLGFDRQADVGARFDPARHEAVATVPDAQAPPGTVVQVLRPGYGDEEHQLRPAAVVVATRGD